jgi:hypothetical protein
MTLKPEEPMEHMPNIPNMPQHQMEHPSDDMPNHQMGEISIFKQICWILLTYVLLFLVAYLTHLFIPIRFYR